MEDDDNGQNRSGGETGEEVNPLPVDPKPTKKSLNEFSEDDQLVMLRYLAQPRTVEDTFKSANQSLDHNIVHFVKK